MVAAAVFTRGFSSMEAELHALELAVGSFLLIDKEGVAQIPHDVDQIMDSLPFPLSSRL